MGPGVGKAISALSITAAKSKSKYQHKVLLLEKPTNFNYITICKDNGVDVFWSQDKKELNNIISEADIVQLEWWHHPLVLGFLKNLSKIPIRLTIWSHISGCNYPIIPSTLIDLPEHHFFTTAYSYENLFWNETDRRRVISNSTIACGSGGYDTMSGLQPKSHSGFNIGFVGTLDFRKLHPDFIDFCAEVKLPDTKFILVGNPENKANILRQAKEKGIENNFDFTGFTNDVKSQLERFDIFGYLLNPDHFGTTDNALLEAMAAALPIIVLNQCGEKHIIRHMKSGIIVNTIKEYGQAAKLLYDNPELRQKLGNNARDSAFNEYSPESTMHKLHEQYGHIIMRPKKHYSFTDVFGREPYHWFISGLGDEREVFETSIRHNIPNISEFETQILMSRDILKGLTKSSISHFYKHFPFDSKLRYWHEIINRKEG